MGGEESDRLGYEERLAVVEAELYAHAENVFDTRPETFQRAEFAGMPRNVLRVIELVASFWVNVHESGGVWDSRKRAFALHAMLFVAYLEEGMQREADEHLRQLLPGRLAEADRRILAEAAWTVLCEMILRKAETKDPYGDFANEALLAYKTERALQGGEAGRPSEIGREDRVGIDRRAVARLEKGKPWSRVRVESIGLDESVATNPKESAVRHGLTSATFPSPLEAIEILEVVKERQAEADRQAALLTESTSPRDPIEEAVLANRAAGMSWERARRAANAPRAVADRLRKRENRS